MTEQGSHAHRHGPSAERDARALWIALVLVGGFIVVEVVAAAVSGSLALLADAGHMLTDAGALAAALWAIHLAGRPATAAWTYGLKRAEILAAAANGITLLVMAALLAFEAILRLAHPPPVSGTALIVVGSAGVAVNLAATFVLGRTDLRSLNMRGAFLHVATDLFAFVATIVAGVVIAVTGNRRADPIATLVVVALMLWAAWGLLRDSGRVLLEGAPGGVDLEEVRRHMFELPEVVDVHDLHAWTLSSELPILSAHVVVADDCLTEGAAPRVLAHLQECLAGHFDVEHSTFQLEVESHAMGERSVHD
jgi:cobalt-zinc-cadmium efflux system protein